MPSANIAVIRVVIQVHGWTFITTVSVVYVYKRADHIGLYVHDSGNRIHYEESFHVLCLLAASRLC